jgi:hypothetical protein
MAMPEAGDLILGSGDFARYGSAIPVEPGL